MEPTLSEENPRIPASFDGIQVNLCKNPSCSNFGVPASSQKQPMGRGAKEREQDFYTVAGGSGPGVPVLCCHSCGEYPTIKSNQGIHEEVQRFSAYQRSKTMSCPNSTCASQAVDIAVGKAGYHSLGKPRSGSKRYRCKLCKTTFAVQGPTTGHKKPIKIFRSFSC